LSCAARGVVRQLLRGLPYLRAGAIEVFVHFMPQRLARVAGHWVTASTVSQVTNTFKVVGGGGGGKGDGGCCGGVGVFTAVVGVRVVGGGREGAGGREGVTAETQPRGSATVLRRTISGVELYLGFVGRTCDITSADYWAEGAR
jgi:hypothetical protein